MGKIWVKIDPWDKEMVTTALEGGAEGIMVPAGCGKKVKELGRVLTIAEDGDLVPGEDVVEYAITSCEDEEEIVKLLADKKVILRCNDWTIIPLENLIARGAPVIPYTESFDEVRTSFEILEKGVERVLFHAGDMMELKRVLSELSGGADQTPLEVAVIEEIRPIGMGDRVCVDTCSSMEPGEGMLVGNSSSALFLVHAESLENPYVAARPFRINAGAVHAYIRVPGGKTRYLSELSSGDPVLITDYRGVSTPGAVGRLKIEKRPMLLVRARAGEREVTTIVQNAETIRLTDPEGNAVSVVNLAPGDRVLVAVEECGRHFGHKIEETITEK